MLEHFVRAEEMARMLALVSDSSKTQDIVFIFVLSLYIF